MIAAIWIAISMCAAAQSIIFYRLRKRQDGSEEILMRVITAQRKAIEKLAERVRLVETRGVLR
jgi:hypothetical protein